MEQNERYEIKCPHCKEIHYLYEYLDDLEYYDYLCPIECSKCEMNITIDWNCKSKELDYYIE